MSMDNNSISAALQRLRPGAAWSLDGDSLAGLTWRDTAQTRPTDAEVEAAIPVALQAAANRRRVTEIDAALTTLDARSIRALRSQDSARLAAIETEAAALREERAGLVV